MEGLKSVTERGLAACYLLMKLHCLSVLLRQGVICHFGQSDPMRHETKLDKRWLFITHPHPTTKPTDIPHPHRAPMFRVLCTLLDTLGDWTMSQCRTKTLALAILALAILALASKLSPIQIRLTIYLLLTLPSVSYHLLKKGTAQKSQNGKQQSSLLILGCCCHSTILKSKHLQFKRRFILWPSLC